MHRTLTRGVVSAEQVFGVLSPPQPDVAVLSVVDAPAVSDPCVVSGWDMVCGVYGQI